MNFTLVGLVHAVSVKNPMLNRSTEMLVVIMFPKNTVMVLVVVLQKILHVFSEMRGAIALSRERVV